MSTEQSQVPEQSAPVELDNAKPEDQNTPEVTAASGEVDKQEQAKDERKFTQAELDAAIQKRLNKEQRRIERQLREQLEKQQVAQPPKREAFQDEEAFTQAQIEHMAEQLAQRKLEQRAKAERSEKIAETFQEKAEKASERYPDFNVVVANPMLKINESMVEFIAESDHGPDVAYWLGKNPDKADQIAEMSPVKAARELARIEAELAAKPKATPSKAPEPIAPVGSRGKSSASTLPSDDDDIETWMRKERERTARRR